MNERAFRAATGTDVRRVILPALERRGFVIEPEATALFVHAVTGEAMTLEDGPHVAREVDGQGRRRRELGHIHGGGTSRGRRYSESQH